MPERNRFVHLVIFLVAHRQYYQVFRTDLGLSNSYVEVATEDRLFNHRSVSRINVCVYKMTEAAHYSEVKFVYSHVKCMYTLYFSMAEKELVFSKPQQSSSSHDHANKESQQLEMFCRKQTSSYQ